MGHQIQIATIALILTLINTHTHTHTLMSCEGGEGGEEAEDFLLQPAHPSQPVVYPSVGSYAVNLYDGIKSNCGGPEQQLEGPGPPGPSVEPRLVKCR